MFLCILNKILYCNDKSALEQPKAVCMGFPRERAEIKTLSERKECMKKLLALVLALAITLTLTACVGNKTKSSANGESVDEIVIGNLLPLSGTAASLGKIGQQARDMAVEEINEAGGIKSMDGAKIRMVYADSKGDSAKASLRLRSWLLRMRSQLITGCYQSGVCMASTEVAERYQIPYFVPVPSDDQITARRYEVYLQTG